MPSNFQRSIRTAIQDQTLQSALDLNARRRYEGRLAAMATLEDPQAARRMAHAVRAETIANLDAYLEQFIQRAGENGMILHRAAGPAEANEIILEIIRRQGTGLVAKSKSMVSEEIHLNRALEAAGVQAVETDLGEYIVQLRRERPSHIITPAVHLTRKQVSDTFQREIGIPPTDDIGDLTAAARRELRRVFLTAGVGISGVNFGVAESGALCIVTNEGNGRMVTSLPPVHIALMGIERLVPTWDDLALMLSLLPRAATGQKITVYVNLVRQPRQQGEIDGPIERHLVLVDNGRSSLRASPLSEALLCIRCGACLNACPVFREIGGHAYIGRSGGETPYPGPIGSIIAPGLFGQGEFGHLARASTLCGACKEACPVDIDLPKLLLRTRVGGRTGESPGGTAPWHFSLAVRIYSWLASDAHRFRAAQRLGAALAPLLSPRSRWMRLPAFTGWGVSRRLPRPVKPFSARFSESVKQRGSGQATAVDGQRSEVSQSKTADSGQTTEDGQRATAGGGQRLAVDSLLPDGEDTGSQRIERFGRELEALGGVFRPCRPADLESELVSLLNDLHVGKLIAWEQDQLPDALRDRLTAEGFEVWSEWGTEAEEKTAAGPSVGLTGALAGIAETGTLVLTAGPGRSLSASLIPEIHVAVLHSREILETLPAALALPRVQEASSAILISGPSRTADIEMTLTVGVHGPRQVYVFCLTDQA